MKRTEPHCDTCASRSQGIFCSLTGNVQEDLDRQKATKHYPRGKLLFEEGGIAEGLFCIRSGKVKLFKSGSKGKQVILGIAKSGDVLGFRSVLIKEPYHRSAEVLEDAEICFIEKEVFGKLMQTNPNLAFDVIHHMAHELENVEGRVSDFLNVDVRTRFIRLLMLLKKTYGVDDMTGTMVNVRLTRQEMGEMVGAAPETIIRILSDLENDKFISMDGRRIKILDSHRLAQEANIEN